MQSYGSGILTLHPKDISVSGSSSPTNLVCTPVGIEGIEITCTVDITSSGILTVTATNSGSGTSSALET